MAKTDIRGCGWGGRGREGPRTGRLGDDVEQRLPPGSVQDQQQRGGRPRPGGGGACSRTRPRTEDTGWKCQCGWRRSRMLHSREKADGQLLLTLRRSQARTSLPGLNLRPCRGLRLFRRVPLFATPWTVAHQLLCPWDSLQEYWSRWRALLQGIFLIQGWNAGLLHCRAGS